MLTLVDDKNIFNPFIINDITSSIKNKANGVKKSIAFNVAFKSSEILELKTSNFLEELDKEYKNIELSTLKLIDYGQIFDQHSNFIDTLQDVLDSLEKPSNENEKALYEKIDTILDNMYQINSIYSYFEAKVLRENLKIA